VRKHNSRDSNITFFKSIAELPGIESCGPGKLKCFAHISSLYMEDALENCKCLPGCNSIQYEKEVSMNDLKITNLTATHGDHSEE
jgi:hypothetical protein